MRFQTLELEKVLKTEFQKEVGYLGENQYLEKFQCVVLRKIDNNTYDIAFQNIQEGIRFNKLFLNLKSFLKNKNNNINELKMLI